jgi:hypothetical protein
MNEKLRIFQKSNIFSYILRLFYDDKSIAGVVCYPPEIQNWGTLGESCDFFDEGLLLPSLSGIKEPIILPPPQLASQLPAGAQLWSFGDLIAFEYSDEEGAILLENIPEEYLPGPGTVEYNPYKHINIHSQPPPLALSMFASERKLDTASSKGGFLSAWIGTSLSDDDKLDCANSQTGQCSFSFLGDGTISILSQVIYKHGDAGESFILSVWSKADNVAGSSLNIIRVILMGDEDSQTQDLILTEGTHNNWEKREINFTTVKPYKRIKVEIIYSEENGRIWVDELNLIKNSPLSNLPLELLRNKSFEVAIKADLFDVLGRLTIRK